jgi:hypothetical protein
MAGIFISYRHEDSPGVAGRLFDRVKARFDDEHELFVDDESLELGEDFSKWIRKTVPSCRVLIVVIGKNWLSAADEDGHARLRNPDDWVRNEIRMALDGDLLVIPVLVGGARMPKARELPRPLAGLARRTALEISNAGFDQGAKRLIERLEEYLGRAHAARASSGESSADVSSEPHWSPLRLSQPVKPTPARGEKKFGKDGLLYEWIPPSYEYGSASPVGNGFWIATSYATNENFRRATGRDSASPGSGIEGLPAMLSYSEAMEYCAAIGGRLPTPSELQQAPRVTLPTLLVLNPVPFWTSGLRSHSGLLRAVLEI